MAATSQRPIDRALAPRNSGRPDPNDSAAPNNPIPPVIYELLAHVRAKGDAECILQVSPPRPTLYFLIRVRGLPEQLRTARVLWDAMDRGLIHFGSWHAQLAPYEIRHIEFGHFHVGTSWHSMAEPVPAYFSSSWMHLPTTEADIESLREADTSNEYGLAIGLTDEGRHESARRANQLQSIESRPKSEKRTLTRRSPKPAAFTTKEKAFYDAFKRNKGRLDWLERVRQELGIKSTTTLYRQYHAVRDKLPAFRSASANDSRKLITEILKDTPDLPPLRGMGQAK